MKSPKDVATGPEVVTGTMVIKGTRLSVAHTPGLFEKGAGESGILESYQHLSSVEVLVYPRDNDRNIMVSGAFVMTAHVRSFDNLKTTCSLSPPYNG